MSSEEDIRREIEQWRREDFTNPDSLFAEFWRSLGAYQANPKQAAYSNLKSQWETLDDAKASMAFANTYKPDMMIRAIQHQVNALNPSESMKENPSYYYKPVYADGRMFTSADIGAMVKKVGELHQHLYEADGKLRKDFVPDKTLVNGIVLGPYTASASTPQQARNFEFKLVQRKEFPNGGLLPAAHRDKVPSIVSSVYLDQHNRQVEFPTDPNAREQSVLFPGAVRALAISSLMAAQQERGEYTPDFSHYRQQKGFVQASLATNSMLNNKTKATPLTPTHSRVETVASGLSLDAALAAAEKVAADKKLDTFEMGAGRKAVGYNWADVKKHIKAMFVGQCIKDGISSADLEKATCSVEAGHQYKAVCAIIGTEVPPQMMVRAGPQINILAKVGSENYLVNTRMVDPSSNMPEIKITKIQGDVHDCNQIVSASDSKIRVSYHL